MRATKLNFKPDEKRDNGYKVEIVIFDAKKIIEWIDEYKDFITLVSSEKSGKIKEAKNQERQIEEVDHGKP